MSLTAFADTTTPATGGPELLSRLGVQVEDLERTHAPLCSLLATSGYHVLRGTQVDFAGLFLINKLGYPLVLVRDLDGRPDVRTVVGGSVGVSMAGTVCDTTVNLLLNGGYSLAAGYHSDAAAVKVSRVLVLSLDSLVGEAVSEEMARELEKNQHPLRVGTWSFAAGVPREQVVVGLPAPVAPRPATRERNVLVFRALHLPDSSVDSIRVANSIARVWQGPPAALKPGGTKVIPVPSMQTILKLLDSIPDTTVSLPPLDTVTHCEISYNDRSVRCACSQNGKSRHVDAFVDELYRRAGLKANGGE